MAIKLKSIDGREFDRLADQTRLSPAARAMARMILVDGCTTLKTADHFGTSEQCVDLAVSSIRRVHQVGSTTSGLVSLDVDVPDRLSIRLTELVAALQATESQDAKELALSEIEAGLANARDILQGRPSHDRKPEPAS